LSAWSPKAPAPTEKTAAAQIEEDSVIDAARLDSVHESLSRVLESLGSPESSEPHTSTVASAKDSVDDNTSDSQRHDEQRED
jgi:hypothetical protein